MRDTICIDDFKHCSGSRPRNTCRSNHRLITPFGDTIMAMKKVAKKAVKKVVAKKAVKKVAKKAVKKVVAKKAVKKVVKKAVKKAVKKVAKRK
jgi:acyl CoA:acetate/3-ketoacid CoA transferase beta subunit